MRIRCLVFYVVDVTIVFCMHAASWSTYTEVEYLHTPGISPCVGRMAG